MRSFLVDRRAVEVTKGGDGLDILEMRESASTRTRQSKRAKCRTDLTQEAANSIVGKSPLGTGFPNGVRSLVWASVMRNSQKSCDLEEITFCIIASTLAKSSGGTAFARIW